LREFCAESSEGEHDLTDIWESIASGDAPGFQPIFIADGSIKPLSNEGSTFPSISPGVFQAKSIKMNEITDVGPLQEISTSLSVGNSTSQILMRS